MFDLTGRVAVVTGASAGLGQQFAKALAKQGADLAILARRMDKLEHFAEEIRALGVKCLPVICDVTDSKKVSEACQAVVTEFGKVDILVNNAGGGASSPIEEMEDAMWEHVMHLDLDGVFYCTREFGREMLKNDYGRIINVSSILGAGGLPELPVSPYHASKGGVINFTRGAAAEWAQKGITVNALCPGFFASESNSDEAMENMDGFISQRTPMGRPGQAGELDSALIFLAADESSYVTGDILFVDGGWTAV